MIACVFVHLNGMQLSGEMITLIKTLIAIRYLCFA